MKVALFLEESDLAYEVISTDIFKGEQHRKRIRLSLTGDNIPRELAASGIEHRNLVENRAVYGV